MHGPAFDLLHRLAVTAFIVPFLLLSLFSNGTMLTRAANDRVTVILCIGTGQIEMIWDGNGSLTPANKAPAPGHDDNQTCDWQISAQAAVMDSFTDMPPMMVDAVENQLSLDVPLHMRRINVLAGSARGPPRQV